MDTDQSVQALSLRPGFGSPIAAARRYARRHRVLLAAAVVLVGGGAAAGAILTSGSSYAATRPIGAALVKSPLVGSASTHPGVIVQIGVPTIVHFVPRATFAIAVIVTNRASAPITLEQARAVLSHRSPLHQIGAGLFAFKPFVCPPGASCPFIDPIGRPPYGAERPAAVSVAPGQQALARLDFRFNNCRSAAARRAPTTNRVVVVYRTPAGERVRQRLALGDSRPRLTPIARAKLCHR